MTVKAGKQWVGAINVTHHHQLVAARTKSVDGSISMARGLSARNKHYEIEGNGEKK